MDSSRSTARRGRGLVSVVALVLILGVAAARAESPKQRTPTRVSSPARTTVRFLGADPIGPLAQVSRGRLASPPKGACRRWGTKGSRWRKLDILGRVVGIVRVKAREYYHYTRCYELRMTRHEHLPGPGLYVDARAPYVPPKAERWEPDAKALRALERIAAARQRGIANLVPSQRVPFAKRSFFFVWSKSGTRYAVVGGVSLLVLVADRAGWRVVFERKPPRMRSSDRGHALLSVTDMDADGRPEIVVRHRENGGEWYGDFTISLRPDGTWLHLEPGIFGSTA
ncbi:MAG: hypothetical protein KC609_08555 [Myxococcales bacterium]|nr:hypothetical protein [Myxococcales bacterium]